MRQPQVLTGLDGADLTRTEDLIEISRNASANFHNVYAVSTLRRDPSGKGGLSTSLPKPLKSKFQENPIKTSFLGCLPKVSDPELSPTSTRDALRQALKIARL